MRLLMISLLLLTFIGCSVLKKNTITNTDKLLFHELDYGLYKDRIIYNEKQNNSPSGNHIMSDDFKLIKKTDTIPCVLGQSFGIQYILESNKTVHIPVRQVWIFPTEIKNDKGETFKELNYTIKRWTNDSINANYVFEKDWELAKGNWIFRMYYKDKLLKEKIFIIK